MALKPSLVDTRKCINNAVNGFAGAYKESAVMFREGSGGPSIGPACCRETPVSRKTDRYSY